MHKENLSVNLNAT